MKLRVAWIKARPGKDKLAAITQLTAEYVKRIARYVPIETQDFASETALIESISGARTKPVVVLLDPRGKQLTSEEFARWISEHRDGGTQTILFAVGGADGFSPPMVAETVGAGVGKGAMTLSLGKMTLPHELARVVLLEQVYRAFTILKGHPYHAGH